MRVEKNNIYILCYLECGFLFISEISLKTEVKLVITMNCRIYNLYKGKINYNDNKSVEDKLIYTHKDIIHEVL